MNGKKARELRRQAYKTGKNYRDQRKKARKGVPQRVFWKKIDQGRYEKPGFVLEHGTRHNIGLRKLYRDLKKAYRAKKVTA